MLAMQAADVECILAKQQRPLLGRNEMVLENILTGFSKLTHDALEFFFNSFSIKYYKMKHLCFILPDTRHILF